LASGPQVDHLPGRALRLLLSGRLGGAGVDLGRSGRVAYRDSLKEAFEPGRLRELGFEGAALGVEAVDPALALPFEDFAGVEAAAGGGERVDAAELAG
jgi:hypothetical protein